MSRVKCHACGKLSGKIRCVGEGIYCRPCARKIPPVAVIRHAGIVECECGDRASGVQVEFGDESACYCLGCLVEKLADMIGGDEQDSFSFDPEIEEE